MTLQKVSIVLNPVNEWNRHVPLNKETLIMTALIIVIALLAVAAIASTIVVATRDGYRKSPALSR